MALTRCLFEFGIPGFGFSETYWTNLPVQNSINAAITLANQRLGMMPAAVSMRRIRLSLDGVFRDVRAIPGGSNGLGLNGTCPVAPAAEVDSAIGMSLEAGELHAHTQLLRGLPETVIGPNTTYLPNAAGWHARVRLFMDNLQSGPEGAGGGTGPWCIRGFDTTQPPLLISAVTVQSDQRTITITAPQPINVFVGGVFSRIVVVGDRIIIKGVRGAHNVNGIWTISGVPLAFPGAYALYPKNSLVAMPNQGQLQGPLRGHPTARYLAYVGYPIDVADDDVELFNRKTGRPFDSPRGRRSRT